MNAPTTTSGTAVRAMMRARPTASLATNLVRPPMQGWPYASLVLVASDFDAAPLLLISRLAEHTKNIGADDRVSLLYDATAESADRLAGARVTVLGRIARFDEARAKERFVARHPEAEGYAGFADFALYRVAVESAHLVGGFGRIEWITGDAIRFAASGADPLAAAERTLVAELNGKAAGVALARGQGLAGEGWMVTGIDPEGIDLRRDGATGRVAFTIVVRSPAELWNAKELAAAV